MYYSDYDMVKDVLDYFPHLRHDRAIWEVIFDPGNNQVHKCFVDDLEYVLESLVPAPRLGDER